MTSLEGAKVIFLACTAQDEHSKGMSKTLTDPVRGTRTLKLSENRELSETQTEPICKETNLP